MSAPEEEPGLGQILGPHLDELKAHAKKLKLAAADAEEAILQIEHSAEQEDVEIAGIAIKDAHLAIGRGLRFTSRITENLVKTADKL